ncbi:hypothetical protein VSVS12_02724 [Vibrio scophthalmi]|uniref:replication endonuclease n=1 Tax=Vibrio scophthalmi TaxID=45658 RepID=UPI0008092983|nr:replication endonuclease [Vibrio scophthalmi]ANS86473.1 hypothetical protein VSVS12_02724 [Vibrio scophthalmi]
MEQYLEYLRSLDGASKKQNQEYQLNNYISYDWNFGSDAKSNILNDLLNANEISSQVFNQINKTIQIDLNTNPIDILNSRDFSLVSKLFSIWSKQFESRIDFEFYGLDFDSFLPQDKNLENAEIIALKKMQDSNLVFGRLSKIYKQQLELLQIKRGNVSEYMSETIFKLMTEQKEKSNEYLASRFIEVGEDDDVEQISLLDMQNKTKQNKINELMVIKKHIQNITSDGEWGARFVTVTNRPEQLPRAYDKSDKTHWDGITTPSDNAKQLQRVWRNLQSYANRKGIPLIGVWCREPHKKGGIHQHLLVLTKVEFLENDSLVKNMTTYQTLNKLGKYNQIKNEILSNKEITLDRMFLSYFGYTNRSCKIDVLVNDKKTNSVINYITKYIMKTCSVKEYNGTFIDDEQSSFDKVSFHRSLWNYRAYGFFGFKNKISVWRFLRKVQNSRHYLTSSIAGVMEEALEFVKDNDYSSFMNISESFNFVRTSFLNKHGEPIGKNYAISDGLTDYVFDSNLLVIHFENNVYFEQSLNIEHLDFIKYEIKNK